MTDPSIVRVLVPAEPQIIRVLVPGQTGPAGAAGGSTFTKQAAVALSGHRAVIAVGDDGAAYPDLALRSHAELLLGVTTGAADAGAFATIQGVGEIVEPSWSWAIGPVFCGAAGVLTQSLPPGATWLRQIGVAVAPDRLLVQLRPPIITA